MPGLENSPYTKYGGKRILQSQAWLSEPNRSHRAVCEPYCKTQTGVTVAMEGLERVMLNQEDSQMLSSKGSK